jgi:hypothetical protein
MKIIENIKKIGLKELSNLIFTSPKARRLLLPVADKKIKATFIEMMNNPYEVPAEVEGQYWFTRNLLMRGAERIDENLLSPDIMKTTFNSLVDNVLKQRLTALSTMFYLKGLQLRIRFMLKEELNDRRFFSSVPPNAVICTVRVATPAVTRKLLQVLTGILLTGF